MYLPKPRLLPFASPLIALLFCNLVRADKTFTVKNNCAFTIWPAIYTDLNVAAAVPNQPRGWEAPAGNISTFTVPDDWKSGRIWGRTDCKFGQDPGATSCITGGCNGGLECDPHTGTGVPPVTLAEWTLQGDGNRDFYDVSLVDGFNLPMEIKTSAACHSASCPVDLNANCPAEIAGPKSASGKVAGCKSACLANLDGNQGDSGNCCSGSHNTPETCPPGNVQFYDYFKGACKDSYAYAYDESSGTALWTCDSGLKTDFTLTFCP
ncbi:hypothetical protein NP233_g1048 [Leucocoprinus birnbaumii]|uniref:Thaumatin-like protein n=1 Tax=Leucocoprinus birnbaumii TaxID=56174 RepID=A0AAD5W3K7_9AGAR|nr:hypothetical protein NP233_g1048 [Leucocoprinus birnbaumii]